jgi:hypothetical protein
VSFSKYTCLNPPKRDIEFQALTTTYIKRLRKVTFLYVCAHSIRRSEHRLPPSSVSRVGATPDTSINRYDSMKGIPIMRLELWPSRPGDGFRAAGPVLLTLLVVLGAAPGSAENKVGGHFGFVLPLVTRFDGETTDLSDDFKIGFPTGITVHKSDRLAFDLEFVPIVNDKPLDVDVVIHPGVLVNVGNHLTAGLRMAFEVDAQAWGFTPLIARGFPIQGQNATYFVELDFPVRIQENALGENKTAVGLAFHTGIGF